MSAPIYDLLKRPDELFVVEHAHLQPRFVEDSVRHALRDALDTLPQLDDDDFLLSKQVNFETIHVHDVVAERFGTVGELRGELATGEPSPHQTTLAGWLGGLAPELEAVLGPAAKAADVLAVQHDDGRRSRDPERDDRPRVAEDDDEEHEREGGHDRRERGVPGHDEDDEPHRDADERGERREREERAARGRDHLPALLEAEEHGPRVAEHRRSRGEHADERTADPQPERRGGEPLRDVEERHRDAERAPVDAEDVDAPTLPLPFVRMSSPRTSRGTQ